MNSSPFTLPFCLAFSSVALSLAAADSRGPATPATNATPSAVEAEITQSVFLIPASPKEGRNPFFPQSAAAAPVKPVNHYIDLSSLVLNGITSRPRPSVMINSRTFEKGEEAEVKLPGGGKVLVRCEDITEDSATILVNGTQRRQLRLRSAI